MILQLTIENYRSYKESVTFSMEAYASKSNPSNVATINLAGGQEARVLKTAMIYGANASGKSHIIRVLYEIVNLIVDKPKIEDKLRIYDPYLFDQETKTNPCNFALEFVGPNSIRFEYSFSVFGNTILSERLDYYPAGKIANVFSREEFNPKLKVQQGLLGPGIKGKKEISVFSNQLLLSKFGDDEPHELLSEVFLYFKSIQVHNATNPQHRTSLFKKTSQTLLDNVSLGIKLNRLIKEADTKIESIVVEPFSANNPLNSNDETVNGYQVFGAHKMYEQHKEIGLEYLQLKDESLGTQSLYSMGGEIVEILENGGILVVDELDTSLHPFITKMLLMLFQSESVNPKNAQLIFTTHDVTLLDRDLVRRDQIWIAEKNEQGVSDLFSLQDFEGLREDVPFEKWYLAGKFGGLPQIKSVDSIFADK